MLRQYHAQRRQGGDNPLGVGTVALGSIFYLQDDGYWRARFGHTAVCRTPWIVESFLNGQYHAARRDPATGLFGGADGERAEMIQQAAMVQIYAVLAWAPRHHPKLY